MSEQDEVIGMLEAMRDQKRYRCVFVLFLDVDFFFFGYIVHYHPSTRFRVYQQLSRCRKWIWKLIRRLQRLVVPELQVLGTAYARICASPPNISPPPGPPSNILQKEATLPTLPPFDLPLFRNQCTNRTA